MVLEKIDVNKTLEEARRLLAEEKQLSPAFKSVVEVLLVLVSILVNRLGLHSRNSHIPPSKEPLRYRKTRSPGRSQEAGGQKGHRGSHLKKGDTPDEIEEIYIDRKSLPSGEYQKVGYESRQVFDAKVSLWIKEYRAEILEDQDGRRFVADFPEGVVCATQYGPEVKAQSVYLSLFQLVPLARVKDHFKDQIGLALSKGSIFNFNREAYERLESFESWVKKELLRSKVNHGDETSIRVDGKTLWLHNLSNERVTWYHPDEKRGQAAMDRMGILSQYEGTLCHDHWQPYYNYHRCSHALCNAHHLRELERAYEQEAQQWAKKMQTLLLTLCQEVEQKGGVLSGPRISHYRKQYRLLLKEGEKECPVVPKIKGKKGRTQQSFSRNLLERFKNFEEDTLRFMTSAKVPFTNNQAERDLRMTKVQQKISGCFRSMQGAKIFCRVRAFLSTCKKNNVSPTLALRNLFQGKLPPFIQDG